MVELIEHASMFVREALDIQIAGGDSAAMVILGHRASAIELVGHGPKWLSTRVVVTANFVAEAPDNHGRVLTVSHDQVAHVYEFIGDIFRCASPLALFASKISVLIHCEPAEGAQRHRLRGYMLKLVWGEVTCRAGP